MARRRGTGRTQGRGSGGTPAGAHQAARSDASEGTTYNNNLFSHLDGEMLLWAFEQLESGKAAGVDGISVEEYGRGLEGRLASLLERLHRGTYRPQPSRRRWIPKGDGRQRPLGIPAIEDKIVQRALTAIRRRCTRRSFTTSRMAFGPDAAVTRRCARLPVTSVTDGSTGWSRRTSRGSSTTWTTTGY